jgi:hypothetical protein
VQIAGPFHLAAQNGHKAINTKKKSCPAITSLTAMWDYNETTQE